MMSTTSNDDFDDEVTVPVVPYTAQEAEETAQYPPYETEQPNLPNSAGDAAPPELKIAHQPASANSLNAVRSLGDPFDDEVTVASAPVMSSETFTDEETVYPDMLAMPGQYSDDSTTAMLFADNYQSFGPPDTGEPQVMQPWRPTRSRPLPPVEKLKKNFL